MNIVFGILIPFLGTTIGASLVFFMKNKINVNIEKILIGLAAGVMVSASFGSLLSPAMELAIIQKIEPWIPTSIGFMVGMLFLILINLVIKKIKNEKKLEINKTFMLTFAVILHNIPEGMAVGVAFAGALSKNMIMTVSSAFAISIGIAIQNFPEGAIISMPIKGEGKNKTKAFLIGMLSGVVEPIFAFITLYITSFINSILPYILSFAAGAMFFVVIDELIPEGQSNRKDNLLNIGFMFGFVIMMILDTMLG